MTVGSKLLKEKIMLKLNVFGPYFGLPDASPFCIKALMLLKMSGLPHEVEKMSFKKAPKGKAPYLIDNGKVIADSHFLMLHLEKVHKADFSGGYSAAELAKSWAVARMIEEHFYFISMHYRWLQDTNFYKGPYQFFADAPAIIRPLIARIVRAKVRKTQNLQGLGRHTPEERLALAKGDIDAVEVMLGKNNYFLGPKISGVDASLCGFLWAASTSYFDSPVGQYIRSRPLLVEYLKRIQTQYFPEFTL
jgi:glutathione S-transferase